VNDFLNSEVGISQWEGANLVWGKRNVGLTYRKMWHCSVDVAYLWLSDWTHLQWALHSL